MIRRVAILLLFVCSTVNAQFQPGQILTAAQLNAAFANVLSLAGGVLNGPLTVPTLTVTGTENIANVNITGGTISGLSSPIAVPSGGTGNGTFSAHAVIVGEGTSALAAVGPGTAGLPLVSGGSSADPSYSALSLASLATQAANTVVANSTSASAAPAAVTIPSCSNSTAALIWTANVGFGCRTNAALTTGTLAQFASTTSAQLAGVISDETGSGALVFGTSPTISGASISGGGGINGVPIGGTTPSTAAFTTLSANSTVSGSGFTTLLSPYAPLASPAFTGIPTAPTATLGTNTTQIATTAFVAAAHGRLLNVQVFTTSGTYTPTSGTASAIIEVQAPGGGSGGTSTTNASTVAVSAAGAAGSYAKVYWTSASSQTVTIGAAGTAGAAAGTGGTGGTTSLGSIVSCPGGTGGAAGAAITPPFSTPPAGTTAACTITGATTILSTTGSRGGFGIAIAANTFIVGLGGSAFLGSQLYSATSGYGTGASGNNIGPSLSGAAGNAGSPAVIIIYEYS